MQVLGSPAWQLKQSNDFSPSQHIKGYLRYALTYDEGIRNVVVKRGADDWDIDGRIISRCEVVLAWQMLPRKIRWAIWDRIVCKRPVYEVSLATGVTPRMVQYRVNKGLTMMVGRIYEPLE